MFVKSLASLIDVRNYSGSLAIQSSSLSISHTPNLSRGEKTEREKKKEKEYSVFLSSDWWNWVMQPTQCSSFIISHDSPHTTQLKHEGITGG